jgi:cell division protein FtsB
MVFNLVVLGFPFGFYMFRNAFPLIVLLFALCIGVGTLFSEQGYGRVQALGKSLKSLEQKNEGALDELESLRREVLALASDKRSIEKAARNELSMARDDEIVFLFPDSPEERSK